MQHLPLPVTAADDEAVLDLLCQDAFWEPHLEDWRAAYQAYHEHCGSPFALEPRDFGVAEAARQYKLYDDRKNSGELKRMRRKPGLKSCPVCGSPVTGDLDHYLPRGVYREFSIMRANLVPACRHCNSGVKGTTVRGNEPRRFIHPYFDTWAAQPIWYVEPIPPYRAATFKPLPMADLVPPQSEIVEFHLENVLGVQFHLWAATFWSTLPGQVKLRDGVLSADSVTCQIDQELAVATHALGGNSWNAALLRGIRRDPAAIDHVRLEAIAAPQAARNALLLG